MAEIVAMDPNSPDPARVERAADRIRQAEVIAIPTDTVYGLAANPFDLRAVERVFVVKGRPADAPLLLLVDSLEMAARCAAALPELFFKIAERFWPGPLTLVVPAGTDLPSVVTANTGTVGIRYPTAAIPLAIIRALGSPITATSANLSGQPDCRSAADVATALGDRISLIVDGGPSAAQTPSTVLSLVEGTPRTIREGAISRAALQEFLPHEKQ